MDVSSGPAFQGHIDPEGAWRALSSEAGAFLVDVRTEPEWRFVGAPDLSDTGKSVWMLSWQVYPAMAVNPNFVTELLQQADAMQAQSVYFLCRSGGRSHQAAEAVSAAAPTGTRPMGLFNVAEGFEGDLDSDRRRGALNGWKARGLPWRQS